MARYLSGRPPRGGRLGLIPAGFNPPTVAHVALAEAAAEALSLSQVALVLPEKYPHKAFEATSLEQRVEMICALADSHPLLEPAASEGGLFIEIAREFRELCGPAVDLYLLCGRDAAERIVAWDYAAGSSIDEQLAEFALVVASRGGRYEAPERLRSHVHAVELPDGLDTVSSSAVRAAIAEGEEWEALVPPPVAALIRRRFLYHPKEET